MRHSYIHSFMNFYGCLHSTTAELNSCNSGYVACRVEYIYYLAFYRSTLLTCDVDMHLRVILTERLESWSPIHQFPSISTQGLFPEGFNSPPLIPALKNIRISKYSEFSENSFSTQSHYLIFS